jgi:hypothetical protein
MACRSALIPRSRSAMTTAEGVMNAVSGPAGSAPAAASHIGSSARLRPTAHAPAKAANGAAVSTGRHTALMKPTTSRME